MDPPHRQATNCIKSLFVPFIERQSHDADPSLELGSQSIYGVQHCNQFIQSYYHSLCMYRSCGTTLVASKGEQQKNNALLSPNGISVGVPGRRLALSKAPAISSRSLILI